MSIFVFFWNFLQNWFKYKNPPHGSFRHCYKDPTYLFGDHSSHSSRHFYAFKYCEDTYNSVHTYTITSHLLLKQTQNNKLHDDSSLRTIRSNDTIERYNLPAKRSRSKSKHKLPYKCKMDMWDLKFPPTYKITLVKKPLMKMVHFELCLGFKWLPRSIYVQQYVFFGAQNITKTVDITHKKEGTKSIHGEILEVPSKHL